MMDDKRGFSLAKKTAFRYLKIRERSVFEMREKLALKKIDQAVIDQVVQYLLEKKFLDDVSFARNWIRYRQARPFGPQRIRLELKQKGLDEEIIIREMQAAFEQHDQWEEVLEMARRRAVRYQMDEPLKRKKKVFDFLARRGFSLEMIKKAIKNI
jgi:regulatory protein